MNRSSGSPPRPSIAIAVVASRSATPERVARILQCRGYRTERAATLDDLRARPAFDLVFVSFSPGCPETASSLKAFKDRHGATLVVGLGQGLSAESVVAAYRAGACDVLLEPFTDEQVVEVADRAVILRTKGDERRQMAERLEGERAKVRELQQQIHPAGPFARLLGTSPAVRRLRDTLREVARVDSTVLVTGESGTGKGLIARIIHDASSRAGGPFVAASCVAFSEGLLHSELFGHEKGAFTGASHQKKGRFELARGGTLFLDEIGEVSPSTQMLLLRVLQERSFERVGGEETLDNDARVIAATNADLQAAIRLGRFRSDLYFRLNVIPVHVPPLREHLEDVPILVTHLLRQFSERAGRDVVGMTPEATELLAGYAWPGNVRELENLIERLVVLSRASVLDVDDLPPGFRVDGRTRLRTSGTLRELEATRILDALHSSGGNKKLAASRLGIHRSTLYAKMKRYGILLPEDPEETSLEASAQAGIVGRAS